MRRIRERKRKAQSTAAATATVTATPTPESAKRRRTAMPPSSSRKSAEGSTTEMKAPRVNERSLDPTTGALRGRLSHCGTFHCPIQPTTKHPACALHRFLRGVVILCPFLCLCPLLCLLFLHSQGHNFETPIFNCNSVQALHQKVDAHWHTILYNPHSRILAIDSPS